MNMLDSVPKDIGAIIGGSLVLILYSSLEYSVESSFSVDHDYTLTFCSCPHIPPQHSDPGPQSLDTVCSVHRSLAGSGQWLSRSRFSSDQHMIGSS